MSAPAPGAPASAAAGERTDRTLLGIAGVGAAVTVALGAYGRLHTPSPVHVHVPVYSGLVEAKVWLTTLAAGLAVVQLLTALAMYGRLPRISGVAAGRLGPVVGRVHRWSGRLAFLAAAPVAAHCLYVFGLQGSDLRVLAHSVLGCLFFGAFSTKMLALSRRGLPAWVLPVLGGTVFALLVLVWGTSAAWFFSTAGVHW